MENVKRIYADNNANFSPVHTEYCVVGSNAIKILEEKYENNCEVVDINSCIKNEKFDNKIYPRSFNKIFLSAIFVIFAIFMGGVLGYITESNDYTIKEYYVQSNDTLWEIASNINVNKNITDIVEEIKEINGLENSNLQIGQTILIPSN